MSHTTRERALRHIRRASGNLDNSLEHLLDVKVVYQDEHPDISGNVEAVMVCIVKVQELVNGLLKTF